jgi:tetratricopeptide (TPR) repeat protein
MSSRRAVNRRTPPISAPAAPPYARLWAAAIVIAGCLAYANSVTNPFVLDDERAILGNAQIRSLWPLSGPLSPPDETPVARRPIVNLSFAVNYAVGGLDPAGYHAGNLAILLLTALALFGVVGRALALQRLSPGFGRHATAIAGVSALIWSLHPLHTEIVNYVSQRTTALMGLFYLLTMYCSVRALAAGSARWRAGAVLACAAGMACKESMVTAPVLVVLFDRVFVFDSLREALRRRGTFYASLAGTWLLLAALMASGGRTTVGFDAGVSAWTYLLNQFTVLVNYLQLTFWPRDLIVDYGLPQPLTIGEVVVPGVILAALGIATLAALRYRPFAGFLGTAFFLALAPTSSIVPIVTEVGAERRMYLPLAAIIVLVVCAAYRAGRALLPRVGGLLASPEGELGAARIRWAAGGIVAVVAGLLAAGTVTRNREYASPESLARTIVERKPHGRAYYSLGHALFQAGQRDDALRYFRRSAADFPGARFALGAEMLNDGELEAGIQELRTFIELMPTHAAVGGARQMIASALAAQGRIDAAIDELRLALKVDPREPRGNALLGELLLRQRQLPEAVTYLGRAVALQPSDARLSDLLGTAYALQGQLTAALPHFQRALSLDPSHPTARANVERAQQLLARGANAR